ncbi:MAG: hypothetical protein ACOCXJ_02650 [Planctomycetota bacterium]
MLWDPIWHPRLLLLLGIGLLLLLLVRALRERRQARLALQSPGLILRAITLLGLILLACDPHLVQLTPVPERPRLQALIDSSTSMATADTPAGSRLDAAREALLAAESRLAGAFDLHLARLDGELQDLPRARLPELRPDGDASALGAGLAQAVDAVAGPGSAGVLLLTDGRATDDGARDAARLALARQVPLWLCGFGGPVPQRDLRLYAPSHEVLAFAGAEVALAVELEQTGLPGRAFDIRIQADAGPEQVHEARPDADGRARITARVQAPANGEMAVRCRVDSVDGETRSDNNETVIYVRAVADRARVLLLEGQPHWDSKFLVQSLVRCEQVELTAIHQLADGRRFTVHDDADPDRDDTDVLPADAASLASYDCIVLGRACDELLAAIGTDLLADWVAEHGGNLILARGRPVFGRFAAIEALDPLVYGSGQVGGRLLPAAGAETHPLFDLAAGADDRALLADLPALDAVQATDGVKPLARILAENGGSGRSIVLAQQPYGLGRVVTVNAAGLWRWAFHERRNEFDEFVYDRFWVGLLRWLLAGSDFRPGHNVALDSERRVYTDEQVLRLQVRSRGLDPEFLQPVVSIAGPGGASSVQPRHLGDGRFQAEVGPYPPGTYTVHLSGTGAEPADLSMQLRVISASIEQREPSADPQLLQEVAAIAEGSLLRGEQLSDLPRLLRDWHRERQLSDETRSLWDRWWILALLLGALSGEWLLRRRGGLL